MGVREPDLVKREMQGTDDSTTAEGKNDEKAVHKDPSNCCFSLSSPPPSLLESTRRCPGKDPPMVLPKST